MTRRFRSAVDGKFVSAEVATEHPDTTVSEAIVPARYVEITGEMLDAGEDMLKHWSRLDYLPIDECVIQIYLAMRALEQ